MEGPNSQLPVKSEKDNKESKWDSKMDDQDKKSREYYKNIEQTIEIHK